MPKHERSTDGSAAGAAPPPHRPHVTRFGRRHTLLLGLLSTLIALALLETGTRLFRPHVSYEEWRRSSLRYVYEPQWHWSLMPGEYAAPFNRLLINEDGLRGERLSPEKPAGRLRIACLGGSSTFNHAARGERTWPYVIGKILRRELQQTVEIINGGTPGYSTYQSSKRFEHQFIHWDPDLVIVNHMWNDLKHIWLVDEEAVLSEWDEQGRRNESPTQLDSYPILDAISSWSQFLTHVRFSWIRWRLQRKQIAEEGLIYPALDKQMTSEGVAFYRQNLERIAALCKGRDIPLLIVNQPLLFRAGNTPEERELVRLEQVGLTADRLEEAVATCYAINASVAENSPLARVVSTEGFEPNLRHFTDHVHLKPEGIEGLAKVIAEAAADALTAQSR